MAGMNVVGDRFGGGPDVPPPGGQERPGDEEGVAVLVPYLEAERDGTGGRAARIVMATVKGDVHDIGKNIVGVCWAATTTR